MNVKLSNFVRRQTKDSEFSYFDGTDEELLKLINIGGWRQGYREGVQLVRVLPDKFYSSVCVLEEGDKLAGEYKARRKGEEPRKSTYKVGGEKMPAKQVDIVLYHKDVLAEDGDRSTDADWEVISINASPVVGDMPMPPATLMANHFHWSGGTVTNMSDEEFVKQLKISAEWWKDKCLLEPKN